MKIAQLFAAAGLMIASLGATASADAQGRFDDRRIERREDRRDFRNDRREYRRDVREARRDFRHDQRDYRRDRRHDRYGYNGRNRCRVTRRNHRQVRVCR